MAYVYGTITLTGMAKLLALLKSRLISSEPLARQLRIELEACLYEITYKLNKIQNTSLELIALSEDKCLTLDEDSRAGLKHTQEQINEWMDFLSQQAREIQSEYTKVLKKVEEDKEAFILKLGQEVAPHLTMKQHKTEIRRLGLIKFAQIGKNSQDEDKGPSERTSERVLFTELECYLKNLCLHSQTSKTKQKDSLIHQTTSSQKSKLTKSAIVIQVPSCIQELFTFLATFSKEHYLFGSAALDCILKAYKQESIFPEDLDVITLCPQNKIIAAGFNPCRYIKDLHYYQLGQWRIELTKIEEAIFTYMANRLFTISTLFCEKQGDSYVVQDLTGRGLSDLEQRRLVTLKDPNKVFSEDPTTILLCFKYLLKGFHPDLKIINALNTELVEQFDRAHFNAVAKKQLQGLNLEERKHYVNLFVQYGLLKKLFEINYDCDLAKSVVDLENKLEVASAYVATNQHRLFVTNSGLENKDYAHLHQKSS